MRENGQTAMPKPVRLEEAKQFSVPSREKGRDIPCRLVKPDGESRVQGVLMHIHGGGWVLMSEKE
jgi:acetyl esterase/lipase